MNEAKTDLWVYELLKDAEIHLDAQGSSIKEVQAALSTASKSGSGKVGFPEYVGIVRDFLLVVEDKADVSKQIKYDAKGVISQSVQDVKNYAVNGALFYGLHLAAKTSYKKVLAFGISGHERKHHISPLFIDERGEYRELPQVESFVSFSEANIRDYYTREILGEKADEDKDLAEILKQAAELHEDLRNYGSLKDQDKPLVVSGLLLALREREYGNFSIEELSADSLKLDGQKIYDAIEANLKRSQVAPEVKRDKILSQFALIKDMQALNGKNEELGKTPLRHYAEFLDKNIYKNIKYMRSSEDYLGRFYGEFMSYSGGDGQTLGIILTPRHITDLFCDLLDVGPDDVVFDPCAGTAGFLIAAMHYMLERASDESARDQIRKNHLHGIELQPHMFTVATTNMILRGDGKSNLLNKNFLGEKPSQLQIKGANVGMMNPPYSQGSKNNPGLYEIAFTERLLDSIVSDGRVAVIIPQSSMTGKTKEEKSVRANILKHHTLEGVITLNKDTFYRVGVIPCIAVFKTGTAHPKDKTCKFIDFTDDGYKVSKHVGLLPTEKAKDRKQHLLDVWFGRIAAETDFCVQATIEPEDEWLHGFYYFDDSIPEAADFEKAIGDYLTFEFEMIMQGRGYLFGAKNKVKPNHKKIQPLQSKQWDSFFTKDVFPSIKRGKRLTKREQLDGNKPYISSTADTNGVDNFLSNSQGVRTYSNCLTLANSGSVGSCFYHPYSFVASDHVTHLKNDDFSPYVYLFIAPILGRLRNKYNFNREINDSRISREQILLPVNDRGLPDYAYMRQHSVNIEIQKRAEYSQFTSRSNK